MTDWGGLKVVDLRAELKRRGLQHAGLKQELVRRLIDDDTKATAREEPEITRPPRMDTTPAMESEATAVIETSGGFPNAVARETLGTSQEFIAPESEPHPTVAAPHAPQAAGPRPSPTVEDPQDARKRKRRSITPPPDPKRLKADEDEVCTETVEIQQPSKGPLSSHPSQQLGERNFQHLLVEEPTVEASLHPATCALYIRGFMRPLRAQDVRVHLHAIATPSHQEVDENAIDLFYLNPIRTHAFIIFSETAKAVRARSALHGVTWPEESNRRPLWVDFVPPERVRGWIAQEAADGSHQGGAKRWEIAYERDDNGNLTVTLDSTNGPGKGREPNTRSHPAPAQREPPVAAPVAPRNFAYSAAGNANAVPLGPRIGRVARALPPPQQDTVVNMARPEATRGCRATQARPVISYQPVPKDLARERVDAIQSYYTRDAHRDLGRDDEINRYTFEAGGVFVDRGREVFIGIRPPHREAERTRQFGGESTARRRLLPKTYQRGPPGRHMLPNIPLPRGKAAFQQGGGGRLSHLDEAPNDGWGGHASRHS